MSRAKAKGVKIGRPKIGIEMRAIRSSGGLPRGETPYAIAKALRIDRHTAAKYVG